MIESPNKVDICLREDKDLNISVVKKKDQELAKHYKKIIDIAHSIQ